MKRDYKQVALAVLLATVWAFDVQADEVLSSHLRYLMNSPGVSDTARGANHLVQGRQVVVDITVKEQSQVTGLIRKLNDLGASQISSYKKQVSALIAIDQLSQLSQFPEVSWVSSNKAARNALGPPGGSVFNAADTAMFTDVVRKRYNVDGSGVTIGVMSDSYDCLGGAATDVETGDLPLDVEVLKEYPFCEEDGTDEGRAMMQLIYDVAPGAKQLFYSAFVSPTDFAAGIQALADAGADIIVDDIRYFTMPMFQEGPIAQSVNQVKARGVTYFSSAGNFARLSYENDFVGGSEWRSTDRAHDFGRAAGRDSNFYQKLTLPAEQDISITFSWDDPAEIAGGTGAKTDLDIFLLDGQKRQIIASSQDSNVGHNPVEFISINHTRDDSEFYLYISHRAGPEPSRIKYIINGPVAPWNAGIIEETDDQAALYASVDEYPTFSSTIFGHANASGAIAVGAIPYIETPWFGTPIEQAYIESFSSAGGTPILFDDNGRRLSTSKMPLKPEIVAPDNADTTFFGEDTDNNDLPNFSGTSAAAPHAAAMAALLKEKFSFLSPDDISLAMTKGSLDLSDPAMVNESAPLNVNCGQSTYFDWGTGCGLVQADMVFDRVGRMITNDIYLLLETSTDQIIAGVDFEYRFQLMNFSDRALVNTRIRALELPSYVNLLSIDGCTDIDAEEVSCKLDRVAAGEIREMVMRVKPTNNPQGQLRFRADVLTDSWVDLSNTVVNHVISVAELSGDFNYDGCVDVVDWNILFSAMRNGGAFDASLDLDSDGIISNADLVILDSYFSNPSGTACH